MKSFLLFLLLSVSLARAQTLTYPAQWPYTQPFPTNGSTPGTTIKVPGTINPSGYGDNASMWDSFIGGVPQRVGTLTERDAIPLKRRGELQTAFVKEDGGYYILSGGIQNSNWIQLGTVATNGLLALNIFNTDGSLTDNRKMFGNGFDLTFGYTTSLSSFTANVAGDDFASVLTGTNNGWSMLVSSGVLTNYSRVIADDVGVTLSVGGTNTLRLLTPNVSGVTAGDVLTIAGTNGVVEFLPLSTAGGLNTEPIVVKNADGTLRFTGVTIADIIAIGGSNFNFANFDLTLTGDRVHDGDGLSVEFNNFNSVYWQDITNFTIASYITGIDGDTSLQLSSSDASVLLEKTSGLRLDVGSGSTNELRIATSKFRAGTISPGAVLTIISTNVPFGKFGAEVDFLPIPAGSNIANADLTSDGDHTLNGNGFDLAMTGFNNHNFGATNGIIIQAPFISIKGSSFTSINQDSTTTNRFVFVDNRSLPSGTDAVMFRVAGESGNGGHVRYASEITYDVLSSLIAGGPGQNFANTDLTLDADRLHDAASFNLSVTNLGVTAFTGSGGFSATDSTSASLVSGSVSINAYPGSVELNAIGSNTIDLYSDAIDTASATLGQVWTLQNTTTGAGEWADGTAPAPSPNTVVSVDVIADLFTSTANVVVTRGYFSVGDGGHGAYRLDSGSAAATNTVTVFECDAGGRYFLMVSGSISAKQAGAVGDGVADDLDALQGLLDVCEDLAARIEPLTYYVDGGLIVPANVRVIASGATFNFDTTGSDRGFDMESRTQFIGPANINVHAVSGGGSGQDHVAFRIGHYDDGVGQSNIVIRSVTLSTDWNNDNSNCIIVTGDSNDITLEDVTIPSSATLGVGITLHWGFVVSGIATNGTLHPYNIKIRNVNVDELTDATAEASPIFVSACYNVSIENVRSKRARYGAVFTCGDFGYSYSGLAVKDPGSVVFKNVTCERSYNAGLLVINKDSNSDVWPLDCVFESCTLIGSNDATGQGGVYLSSAVGTTFRNCVFTGHEMGTVFTDSSKNLVFDSCTFSTNRMGGFVMDNAGSTGVRLLNSKFNNNGRGLSGTNAAAIRLLDGSQIQVVGNLIGNIGTEPNQEIGVQVATAFVNATLSDNYVYSTKSGGLNVAYHLGGTTTFGNVALFHNNQAASGITLISGPLNVPYLTQGIYRTFTGTGTPTVGTYIKGDMCVFDEATASPFAVKCSVAGTPGTWVTAY